MSVTRTGGGEKGAGRLLVSESRPMAGGHKTDVVGAR